MPIEISVSFFPARVRHAVRERENQRLSRRKDEGGGRGTRDGGDEDEDSWKVRSPWRIILSLLLEGHSLSLSLYASLLPSLALYIFMRNYAKTRGENISTRHRYLTSLTISLSLYLGLRSSSWIATRDNFSISGRFLIAHMKSNLFFFFFLNRSKIKISNRFMIVFLFIYLIQQLR